MNTFPVLAMLASCITITMSALAADVPSPAPMGAEPAKTERVALKEGWQIQSSCKVSEKGEVVSTTAFHPQGWYSAQVPTTVLAALVKDGLFGDPYFGMNLRDIPGTDYPIGKMYNNLPMTDTSPYQCSWWYRTEFHIPAAYAGDNVWLNFKGINYRASIWMNGKRIAASDEVAGAYRAYEFNVKDFARAGAPNVLAVEVSAPTQTDLGINFVDWNPVPADKSMGLWREVTISKSGPVTIRHPQVTTHFKDDSLKVADLTVFAELRNAASDQVSGILEGQIGAIHFSQTVTLAAGEARIIRASVEQIPQLRVKNPRVWWPHTLGSQPLETLKLAFKISNKVSDEDSLRFGIREANSILNVKGFRQFQINRRNILIRGGGWTPDLLYRESRERQRTELQYVQHMGLNAIRLEGKLGSEDLFNLTDEMGILVMAGWCCCDHWEHWTKWSAEDHRIAHASLVSQIERLKAHPSVFVWLNGSDNPPPADVESDYLDVLKTQNWPNPVLSSASATPTTISGASGVKMSGPYDYVPPSYWLSDKSKVGGAYGFNTETSPGPAIPPAASIKKMLPADHLWPIDSFWTFHAAAGSFGQVTNYGNAMNASYGPGSSLEDYSRKSQTMAYDGERAMFEAYARNKYTATGVIQWMLNNAWPSIYWHLYDYYLQPGGGYFGTKKANENLHVQYSYDDRSVYVVNSLYQAYPRLKVTSLLFDYDLKLRDVQSKTIAVGPDSSARVLKVSELPGNTSTSFVKLILKDEAGRKISENFYWLPAQPSVLDWEKSNSFITPITKYEEMTDLANLPRASIRVASSIQRTPAGERVTVKLRNLSHKLAFQIRLRLTRDKGDEEILPIFWDDNYISLLPGDAREITAHWPSSGREDALPVVQVDGWNVPLTRQVPKKVSLSTQLVH